MKNIFKIIIVAIITLCIFILCDIIFFYLCLFEEIKISDTVKKWKKEKIYIPVYSIKLSPPQSYFSEHLQDLRPIMKPHSTENSIIIFGCSYAYGYVFENEQTISYILSKYSKRPIYNYAYNGLGIQHAIYHLEDENFYNDIKTKPKYVIYVLMDSLGHLARLYYTSFPNILSNQYYLTYEKQGKDLIERKPFLNLYYNFAIFRHIQNKLIDKQINKLFIENPKKENFELFILHFKTLNNLIKQKWSDENSKEYPKLIILAFEDNKKELWEDELKKEGIDVIDIADTIGIHNLSDTTKGFFEPETAGHPNGKVWKLLIPYLKENYPDL